MPIYPNRTKFLFLCIIGLLTALTSPPSPTDVDVIIIGAGWSGMGTAHHLVRSNFSNFLVLEATSRTGGRTEAIKFGDPSVGEFMFEVAANWITGAPNADGPSHKKQPIYEEALRVKKSETFNITRIPGGVYNMTNFGAIYDSNGKRADVNGSIRKLANTVLDCLNRLAQRGGKDETLRDAAPKCGWEPKTDAEWVVDWGWSQDANGINASIQSLQGHFADPTYKWWGPDDMFVVDQNPRGFVHLMDTMTAETIPPTDPRLLLDTIVREIDWTATPVKVTSNDGRVFTAKHVISTLPLGVLQCNHSTLFVPPLSERQVTALTQRGAIMSHLTKIHIQFKEPFWDPKVARWLAADHELGAFPEWHNMNHPSHVPGSNTLFIWLGQPQSTRWEKATDAEVIAAIMKNLRHRYPNKTLEDPVAFHISRHSLDPTRYGSYAAYKISFTDRDWTHMIAPLKHGHDTLVYFSGEHTCDTMGGYTHGAWWKGIDAAKDYLGQDGIRLCDYWDNASPRRRK